VTIMQMDAGLDTGDMLLTEAVPIGAKDTTGSLHERLASLGGKLIVQALERAGRAELRPVRQPEAGVSYARKISKAETGVDWSQPAALIERRIRAFDPTPGASTSLGAESIKLWGGHAVFAPAPAHAAAAPGTILSVDDTAVSVACGEGVLRLAQLQRAGGKRLPLPEFLRGFPLTPGRVLGDLT